MKMDIRDIFEKLSGTGQGEWTEGAGDNDDNWQDERPARPQIKLPKLTKLWVTLIVLFLLITVILPWGAKFLTDMEWFSAQGFITVFWRRIIAKWELFLAALIPAFVIYLANWKYACKNSGDELSEVLKGTPIAKLSKRSLLVAAFVMAFINALSSAGYWGTFLKFLYPTPFGTADPIFGLDMSFYIFRLPFILFLQQWLQGVVMVSLVGSALIYIATRTFAFNGRFPEIPRRTQLHLALLGAAFLALWGAGFWLSRYDLLFSPTGVVYGAGYTDIHVILPALTILTVAALLAAAMLVVNIFKPMWKASAIVIALLLGVGFISRTIVPGLIQQYRVKPNEYEMEKSYLSYSLECTRKAFGLDHVQTVAVTPNSEVTADELKADKETIQNIRLWDYEPLLRTYRQLQAIRTYYDFNDIYIDRYDISGKNRQIMLAVRELDLSHFQNPTWVNTHLEFTHGYGVVMNPVNEVAQGGLPLFFMKDLPVNSSVNIPLTRPEIYFGSKEDGYILANTDVKEFDYPMGAANVHSTYSSNGGVKIGSMWQRLLFALRFRDTEILFTGALKPESRVLFNRNVRDALAEIAPFLIYDSDTYPVIYGGRIVWVQDCFSWSSRYPYSRPVSTADATLAYFNGVNYIRNSVKATVDAYNGKMSFYVVDDKDPLVQTWRKIFPKLFKNGSDIPKGLWKHMRYPEDFFEVQADVYRTFHMTDTNTYYNREDVWEITPSGSEQMIRPNYVTMKLWGQKSPEFAIIVPYMPLGRNNLIGWMAGRCDPENYGDLLVYQFPKQKMIYGPTQIEALIDQNTEISAQLSLWSQRGSDVIRGNLLVIPVGKSLLYVQPLYLRAEKGELPELKRIIVSTGGNVEWGSTFGEALAKLMGQKDIESIGTETVTTNQPGVAAGTKAQTAQETGVVALAKKAQSLYDSAQKAQREGNWARYGSEIKQLGAVISELEKRAK
jgi:uncharacterized membrane protein (UPF0182 family)